MNNLDITVHRLRCGAYVKELPEPIVVRYIWATPSETFIVIGDGSSNANRLRDPTERHYQPFFVILHENDDAGFLGELKAAKGDLSVIDERDVMHKAHAAKTTDESSEWEINLKEA